MILFGRRKTGDVRRRATPAGEVYVKHSYRRVIPEFWFGRRQSLGNAIRKKIFGMMMISINCRYRETADGRVQTAKAKAKLADG